MTELVVGVGRYEAEIERQIATKGCRQTGSHERVGGYRLSAVASIAITMAVVVRIHRGVSKDSLVGG
jgi:hypothetical protein